MRTRQAIAIGVGILVIVLLVLGVRGCLDARKERAFKDYVNDVGALVQESNQQSDDLFGLLRDPSRQGAVDLQNAVNGLRVQAEQLVERADGTDHPDELDRAHRYLLDTLEFRRDGIRAIADQLPTALGDEGTEDAINAIAAQMRNFDASDVIYTQRFFPLTREALVDEDLAGERVANSQFLPDIDWLRPTTVEDRISRVSGAGGDRPATPGLHGTGLGTVTVNPGGTQLQPGAATEIRVAENLSFAVQVSNQGENDERDVTVQISVRSGGADPITVEERLDAIAQGETKTVTVPLADTPPTGRPATVSVEIQPVPGEQKTDNNRGRFPVVFTR